MVNAIEVNQRGFVLPTSLVMMLLMTVLSIAVYYGVSVSQSTSASAKSSTAAFYYAETGANYLIWALKNDAEFDSYTYPNPVDTTGGVVRYSFNEPYTRPTPTLTGSGKVFDPLLATPQAVLNDVYAYAYAAGDYSEWQANKGNPSAADSVTGTFDGYSYPGQLMYFDNSTLASRPVACLGTPTAPCVPAIVLENIHVNAPRYIRLDIDSDGKITPALPPYNAAAPHHGSVVGVDIPQNGAIVWLTAGDSYTDRELVPIDKYFAPFQDAYGNAIVINNNNPIAASDVATGTRDPTGNALLGLGGIPVVLQDALGNFFTTSSITTAAGYYQTVDMYCSIYDQDRNLRPSGVFPELLIACDKNGGGWLQNTQYSLVAYAIGYVDGQPRKLIRVVLPSTL